MIKIRQRLAEDTGQALIILALGFVGMVAFVGLAADTLLVIVGQARLVRAVDAAALAAASIYREDASIPDMKDMAEDFVSLNGADPDSVTLATCEGGDPLGLCPGPGPDRLRRKVLVRAQMPVGLAFLRILGFTTVTLTAESVGEAASLDVVLVIDRSESMANDTDFGPKGSDDCDRDGPDADDVRDFDCDGIPDTDPQECNPGDKCEPFRQVKDAAIRFVKFLNPTFDRVTARFFDQEAQPGLTPLTSNFGSVISTIRNADVYSPPACTGFPPDPSACTSTNIGGGLVVANNELVTGPQVRDDALWVVILLTDGAANTTNKIGGGPHAWANVHCPPLYWAQPFCRDNDPTSAIRHPGPDKPLLFDIDEYDSDDWARDMADFVAGNQIVVYTIGLGDLVVNFTAGGDTHAGEQLLRYIAAVGDDGDAETDPCAGVPPSTLDTPQPCGNYFFSPGPEDLRDIFFEIAHRILTRLVR